MPEGHNPGFDTGRAAPQRINSSTSLGQKAPAAPTEEKSRFLRLVVVLAALFALMVAGYWFLLRGPSETERVEEQIDEFSMALQSGDLDRLREVSCGDLRTYYGDVTADQWAKVRKQTMANDDIPTIDGVSRVVVTGDSAAAEVEVTSKGKSTEGRLDLEKVDGQWKVCHQPKLNPAPGDVGHP